MVQFQRILTWAFEYKALGNDRCRVDGLLVDQLYQLGPKNEIRSLDHGNFLTESPKNCYMSDHIIIFP